MTATADITVRPEGISLTLFTGRSETGERWLADRLDPDTPRWGSAYAVPTSSAQPVIDGAQAEGLTVVPETVYQEA